VEDNPALTFRVDDRTTLAQRTVSPAVPFGSEWLPVDGTARERLAAWVIHPENRRFERAVANRAWGLMFGRPWSDPVDDLPNPSPTPDLDADLLDRLGHDFRTSGYDLKRLLLLIASSRAFRLSSQHPAYETGEGSDAVEQAWAVFPLTRLRPEQMIGGMVQASSVRAIDQHSHLITRVIRFFRENDFTNEYGDLGERELEDRVGTIPQALLRMNGRFVQEIADAGPFNASGRVAGMSPTEEACLETAFLCCLTRRPSAEERSHFLPQLQDGRDEARAKGVEDLFWSLFNSPEFCWNH
jgi:hypothetical protein